MARRAAAGAVVRPPAFSSNRVRPLGAAGGGPYDVADLDPTRPPPAGAVDFGALRVPVPAGGVVDLEPPADGRMQAVHVSLREGRLSVSALAAPKTGKLWPDLAKEIDTSLRAGGTRVRSHPGEWGRELHATTGPATSVFVGIDGPRWMVYGVATGPTRDAAALDALLRRMLGGLVVVRGRSPYPVRTVLPLTVPAELAAASTDAQVPMGAATAAFSVVVRAARPGPEMAEGATSPALPVIARPPAPPRRVPADAPRSPFGTSAPSVHRPAVSRPAARPLPVPHSGPTGAELFAPSTTASPRIGFDRSDVAPDPVLDGPAATGRHARPEPPVWRWPEDHAAHRPASVGGIRPGTATERSIRATLRREGTEGHEINGAWPGRGRRHRTVEGPGPGDQPGAAAPDAPPPPRPTGAGRHHRPEL